MLRGRAQCFGEGGLHSRDVKEDGLHNRGRELPPVWLTPDL